MTDDKIQLQFFAGDSTARVVNHFLSHWSQSQFKQTQSTSLNLFVFHFFREMLLELLEAVSLLIQQVK